MTVITGGCSDPELDSLMDEYCQCIQQIKNKEKDDPLECAEIMHSIQQKYSNQPRKLQNVLEKTEECY